MIGSDQTLNIVISAKDEASATLNKFKGNVENMQPTFQKMAAVGAVAFTAIAAGAFSMVNAFADAQAQTELTNQSISNTIDNLSKGALANLQKQLGGTKNAFAGVANAAQAAGAAAVKMGFDDETAANSFAKLFSVTKDNKKAQDELNIAMDLARYKNISLEDATQKLIMVHSGATKELKLLGLAVDDNATAEQNLAAIHKQTADSALTFSETTKGAMEVLNVQVDNLKESIGGALEPVFAKLLTTISPLIQKFADWAEKNPDLLAKIILIAGAVAGLVTVVGTLGLVLPSIITGVTALGTAFTWLSANPIVLVVAAFVGLLVILQKIIDAMNDLKGASASAATAAANAATINQNLSAKIATTTDPKKKAELQSALTQSQAGQQTLTNIANAGFFKNLAVGLGISHYEHGGTIPGAIGQEVPIIAHAGETVIPAGKSKDSSPTVINFNFNGTVAGDDGIKQIIKQAIGTLNRQSSLKTMAGA